MTHGVAGFAAEGAASCGMGRVFLVFFQCCVVLGVVFGVVVGASCGGCGKPLDETCVAATQLAVVSDLATAPGDVAAGIELCGSATWNRVSAEVCDVAVAPGRVCDDASDGDCANDDGCAAGSRCLDSGFGCSCTAVCASDDDCADNEACVCAAGVTTADDGEFVASDTLPRCVPALCRTNSECGDAGECGLAFEGPCQVLSGLSCRGVGDECRDRDDCGNGELCNASDGAAFTCGGAGSCE